VYERLLRTALKLFAMCLSRYSTGPRPLQATPATHSDNPHDGKMLPPPFVKAVDHSVHASRKRHTVC